MTDAPAALSHRETPARDTPKSARTRARILECAQRLFAQIGYAEATNARIAEEAGLTRGAMLYHFPTREALALAAADYIHNARATLMSQAAANPSQGADLAERAIDAYWALLTEPAFVAFTELEAAARTNPMLAGYLAPYQAAFDRAQVGGDELLSLFSAGSGPRFQASRDLARFMLEGMARANLTYDGDARVQRLLAVIKRATHMLNRKGAIQDIWPDDPPSR